MARKHGGRPGARVQTSRRTAGERVRTTITRSLARANAAGPTPRAVASTWRPGASNLRPPPPPPAELPIWPPAAWRGRQLTSSDRHARAFVCLKQTRRPRAPSRSRPPSPSTCITARPPPARAPARVHLLRARLSIERARVHLAQPSHLSGHHLAHSSQLECLGRSACARAFARLVCAARE